MSHHNQHLSVDKVDPQRTLALKQELENLKTKADGLYNTPAVRYYLKKAIEAPVKYERNYFLRGKAGAEQQARQAKNRAYLKEQDNKVKALKQRYDSLEAPTLEIQNHFPRGCILNWTPNGWDDYHIACRKRGTDASHWRSLGFNSNLDENSSELILPERYLTFGDDSPPYELVLMASIDGYRTKLSNIVVYHDPNHDSQHSPESNPDIPPMTEIQQKALESCNAELEFFEETGNLGAIEWVTRAKNSVLDVSTKPFSSEEARKISEGARRKAGQEMWALVAAALRERGK